MYTSLEDYCRFGWQLLNGVRAKGEFQLFQERAKDVEDYVDVDAGLRVLDLGNGYLRPQYSLLQAAGYQVCGIDVVNQPGWTWTKIAYLLARTCYRWKLGLPLRSFSRTLICGDVSCLPFRNETFDLVTSIAAFEHFLDLPSVLSELRRVIRRGGVLYIRIHPFACLSGGHNIRTTQIPLRKLPRGVDPWDHLRKRRLGFNVPLNEWRKQQYLAEFSKNFEVLKEYCAMREGEHLLTPEIESELSDYTRDELTCGAYVIVARKSS
jgi:SAM-dependent methyltransferase